MFALLLALIASALAAPVHVLTLKGGVDPGSAAYIVEGIAAAEQAGAAAVVLELDTPGGLLSSARDIVSAELGSEVPVIVWVGPSGARAGSAGVFLTLAAHVAVMAPGTTIGAAHPVSLFGDNPKEAPAEPATSPPAEQPAEPEGDPAGDPGADPIVDGVDPMSAKILNDTLAWTRAIAAERGRNAAWAESAVRESAAITDREALENGVVDLISPDLRALLDTVDGRVIDLKGEHHTLQTAGAELVRVEMSLRQRIAHFLGDPNVLLALIGLGALGFYIEFQAPGQVIPGAAGALCILAAGVGLSVLPFQLGGLLLVIAGFVAIGLEAYVGGKGVLAVLGGLGVVGGGLLMFDVAGFDLRVNPFALSFVAAFILLVAVGLGAAIARSQGRTVSTGAEGMVAQTGTVIIGGVGGGRVRVQGEDWAASWDGTLEPGAIVRVTKMVGMKLMVESETPTQRGA